MKIAAVTGGSEGIGLGIVEMMISEGYKVVFCSRNEEKGNKVAAKTGARFIRCDVADRDQVKSFYAQVRRLYRGMILKMGFAVKTNFRSNENSIDLMLLLLMLV